MGYIFSYNIYGIRECQAYLSGMLQAQMENVMIGQTQCGRGQF